MKKASYLLLFALSVFLFASCSSVRKSIFNLGLSIERCRSDLDYRTISVGGQRYAYLEREGDGDTIILLHGFAANKDSWIRFVRYVPLSYRVIVLDMPGHGDSRLDMNQTYTVEYVTEGVATIIDSLGIDRFHLAGNSFGGLVSTLYAMDNSGRVITLGLFDAAGAASPVKSEFYRLLEKGDNPLLVASEEDFDRLMSFIFYKEPFIPWPGRPVLAGRFMERSDFNRKMWSDLFEGRLGESLNSRLAALSMPVFIIWGDHDRVLHVSSTKVYEEHIPDPSVVIMKDCGHAPMLERPDEAAMHYSNFLTAKRLDEKKRK